LAAFGERHAYLPYLQLKTVELRSPEAVPQPRGKRNKLVVTSLGAGACIELYGICLFFIGNNQQPLDLLLNTIDKEREWRPNRNYVFAKVLKESFPKLDISHTDINIDLRKAESVASLARHYDDLIDTDILLIYNLMNEIPIIYAKQLWRSIRFLLAIFQRPVLILLVEPSSERADPRVHLVKATIGSNNRLNRHQQRWTFHI
jgi:hypothetical protein